MKDRGRTRTLALLLLVFSQVGCYSWRTDVRDPRDVIHEGPDRVRLTAEGGRRTAVAQPRINGDSITGLSVGGRRATVVVPLDEVRTIEVSRLSPGKTAVGVGIPFLAYILPALTYMACCLHGTP